MTETAKRLDSAMAKAVVRFRKRHSDIPLMTDTVAISATCITPTK